MDRCKQLIYTDGLNIAAGTLTTNWAQAPYPPNIDLGNAEVVRGDGTGQAPDTPSFVNEMMLAFFKVQGLASEIHIQVRESDDGGTTEVIIPIMGAEYYTIDSSNTDSKWIRLPIPVQVRGDTVRIYARYSGGAATTAALQVIWKACATEQFSHPGATALIGAGGLVGEIRKTDLVIEQGMARQTQHVISGGTWATNVVTFTTSAAHGWAIGDSIVVAGCGNANYDGTYVVVSVPLSTTFTAALALGDPGAFTTAGTGDQAQSTTRLVDEDKVWTADEFSTPGHKIEFTDGTGATQQATISDNGTHWIAFSAMTAAPVTDDTTYKVVEEGVPGLVVNTEAHVSLGDIHLSSENFRYRSIEPDLIVGEHVLASVDIKGNIRIAGAEAHSATANRAPVLIGAYASTAAPAAVTATDVSNLWCGLNGFLVIGGYNEDAAANASTVLPIGTDNAVGTDATPDLLKIGGHARAAGAAYTEGDSCLMSFDLLGALRVGGAQAHNAVLSATTNPVLLGAFASDVIQTAVAANDLSQLWASLNGALLGAGLYQHGTPANAVAMTNPVVIDDAVMLTAATAVPVAGQYNSTALTYTNKDACVFQMNVNGALLTTGGTGESDITHGQNVVAVPGTEEALGGDVPILNGQTVLIKALHTNTDAIFVGDSDVTSADGLILYAGESVSLAVTNLNIPYIDSVVAGEGVSYIVEVS